MVVLATTALLTVSCKKDEIEIKKVTILGK